jgi:hypothetical protein
MSINTVHNALLDILQKNTALDTEFSTALTGTVTSTTTTLDGTNTLFLTEVAVDDYVGNPTVGYRRVVSITSNIKLTVASVFDAGLINASIKTTEIKKGIATIEDITSVGKKLRVAFDSSSDIDLEVAKRAGIPVSTMMVLGEYRFTLGLIFSEPNVINIDERKGNYDKWIRDAIDPYLTINGTCVGITDMSVFMFIDHPEDDNIHLGAMAITCYPKLVRGNR